LTSAENRFCERLYRDTLVPDKALVAQQALHYGLDVGSGNAERTKRVLSKGFAARLCRDISSDVVVLREQAEAQWLQGHGGVLAELEGAGFGVAEAVWAIDELSRGGNTNGVVAEISFETVMLRLIADREDQDNADLTEQVQAIDEAILESEEQQGVVSSNKKQRDEEIRTNTALDLATLDDFRHSVLLSASSALRRRVSTKDQSQPEHHRAIANLLLIERNALKWYASACHAYLKQAAARLDATEEMGGGGGIPSQLEGGGGGTSGGGAAAWAAAAAGTKAGAVPHGRLLVCVLEEFEALQTALFAIPSVAGGLPTAFIDADPNALGTDAADMCTVEKDGLEIVGVAPFASYDAVSSSDGGGGGGGNYAGATGPDSDSDSMAD
jgi:hypothetical protein